MIVSLTHEFVCSSCKFICGTEVQEIATVHKVSPAQVALKWLVQRESPIACASWKQDYMKEDLGGPQMRDFVHKLVV